MVTKELRTLELQRFKSPGAPGRGRRKDGMKKCHQSVVQTVPWKPVHTNLQLRFLWNMSLSSVYNQQPRKEQINFLRAYMGNGMFIRSSGLILISLTTINSFCVLSNSKWRIFLKKNSKLLTVSLNKEMSISEKNVL